MNSISNRYIVCLGENWRQLHISSWNVLWNTSLFDYEKYHQNWIQIHCRSSLVVYSSFPRIACLTQNKKMADDCQQKQHFSLSNLFTRFEYSNSISIVKYNVNLDSCKTFMNICSILFSIHFLDLKSVITRTSLLGFLVSIKKLDFFLTMCKQHLSRHMCFRTMEVNLPLLVVPSMNRQGIWGHYNFYSNNSFNLFFIVSN